MKSTSRKRELLKLANPTDVIATIDEAVLSVRWTIQQQLRSLTEYLKENYRDHLESLSETENLEDDE